MDLRFADYQCNSQSDKYPLLMEQPERRNENEHVIDIRRSLEAASSGSAHDRISNELDSTQPEDRPSSSARASVSQLSLPLSNISTSRNSSSRRGNGHSRRRRSPLNSGLWISIELALTLGQIVASIIVLSLSRHEHPRTPLFAWIVGYATGCVATLPLLYWRYLHRNQSSEQDVSLSRQPSSNGNPAVGHSSSLTTQVIEDDNHTSNSNRSASALSVAMGNARLKVSIEYFKMALDCFFAIWFVVGNVWIFGGHASSTEAPNLYRLCIVFLIFSCIGYAMPFILCATICCCLPCIISVLGFREDLNQTRGATTESINALPIYKYKLKKNRHNDGGNEAGVVAAGTEKERVISGEDAVCCICLAKYANNDELRELPCTHLFHKECVDKWLKINALCPLCKNEVGESLLSSLAGATASLRRAESRVVSS
ncbi:E3 ubiquitin-protein ligase At1g12760-like [Chenopodium quinoa]|uniref:E3 ubiquitin-protein ligase At1g12760-like n=1 Tax=Chenopodium quinoa TaxID=63459 RepID=UPI000B78BBCA|nr:E3 ubiquitin-protein ligase At1g12760-like [Chenopodium quinoa]XP_021758097.1 E3 ubiquitin-protein ligase At1g12760-like [Chenopodium quinoa]